MVIDYTRVEILLNNYNQIKYKINDSTEKEIHTINIPKTTGNKYKEYELEISTNHIFNGLNDFILIISYPNNDSERIYTKNNKTFRFSVNKNQNSEQNNTSQIKYNDFHQINGEINTEMMVFDTFFDPISNNNFIDLTKIIKVNNNEPIFIYNNINGLTDNTFFHDEYSNIENNMIEIGIFALNNNKIIPLNSNNDNLLLYKIDPKSSNMLPLDLPIKNPGDLTFFLVNFPNKFPDNFLKTYKMVYWSTIISSQNIEILN